MATRTRQLPLSRRALRGRRARSRASRVPGRPARQRRAGHLAQHRQDRPEQVRYGVTARHGTAGRAVIRHRRWRGPAGGGGPDPAGRGRQVGKRPAGRACYTPAASAARRAAACQPVAMVRMADMTIAVIPADPAACPALPWQASIERRIADFARVAQPPVW